MGRETIVRLCIAAAALFAVITAVHAGARDYSVLYSFCQQQNCADGTEPGGPLVADKAGNLYGVTAYGGSTVCTNGCGTIFKVTPDGAYTLVYAFCAKKTPCLDGRLPTGPLIFDKAGTLYGTTSLGGAHAQGTVFKLAPNGKEKVLYSFCTADGCPNGANPSGGVILDASGNLYGTTWAGGTECGNVGCGTVFKLAPDGTETVLYSFCTQSGCTDGYYPNAGLVLDASGNLYGTTWQGGANAGACNILNGDFCGTVFKVSPGGTETVLHSFCAAKNCADGAGPASGVAMDAAGNLYGTTVAGGKTDPGCPSATGGIGWCGVVFELKPDMTERVLYAFCSQANCSDGAYPSGGVTLKPSKTGMTMFGTAEAGGAQDAGVVFSLTGNKEKVLYAFCSLANCADGDAPASSVVVRGSSVFGTTFQGGAIGAGAVYALEPAGDRAH